MPSKTIDVNEAQKDLRRILSQVKPGNEVILTEKDRPIVRIVAVERSPQKRQAGLHEGKIKMSDDFDAPLPEDFWTGNRTHTVSRRFASAS